MTAVAFALGMLCGGSIGLLAASILRVSADAQRAGTTYVCTCGWCKSIDAPPDVAASWMRCDDCKGIAVRLRDFARDAA
jgi:hypothetical protein